MGVAWAFIHGRHAKHPRRHFELFAMFGNAVGFGILAGMCTGPFFFPLIAGAYYSAMENTFKVLECSTKEKVVMQATEELKDKVIRHMNAGRRSRGLQPRFEDPPALVRWEIYPSK